MFSPKVSIIMPVYNCERFIHKTVKSLLNQTFEDFEFIIIDDNSSDKSYEIISSFSDSRIVLKRGVKRGAVNCYNEGIALAKSELISILDHDDVSEPARLEKEFNVIMNSNYDFVSCYFNIIDENDIVIEKRELPTEDNLIKDMMTYRTCVIHSGCMYKKSLFEKYGPYETDKFPAHDYAFFLRILDYAKFYNIPEYLQNWRVVKSSPSQAKFPEQNSIAYNASYNYLANKYKYHDSIKGKKEKYFQFGRVIYYYNSPFKASVFFLKAFLLGNLSVKNIRYLFFSIFLSPLIKLRRSCYLKKFSKSK